ncbi:MAG TPA: zinc-finger domain-containing protein [Thermopetrobacter sp.]|nr:zinc-finger domain-containing protein [Thermopetrobacter sp.]
MAKEFTPLFHNDMGVAEIEIGARHFGCMGATPPMDHPHVWLEMGDAETVQCPYCSTRFRYNPELAEDECRPHEALFNAPARP